MPKPHLMVMAGGTGGHVYPALAVAKRLQESGTQITWLGTRKGLEARVVPNHNIELKWIEVEGLRGKGAIAWLLAPFKLTKALLQSASAIRAVQPDCVLGMGGFVAGPGGLMARFLGKPMIVHEQNAVAGLTNKYLAKIANRVLTGFPKVVGLPLSARWVGNPVREEIKAISSNQSDAVNVLVLGGSQGAYSFNRYLPSLFAQLDECEFNVWHQTGLGNGEAVNSAYASQDLAANVSEFIDDMAAAYAWADLLICRAGAMTIAELCAAAKPSVLIPYPFSAGDHQDYNAQTLVDVGAALKIDNQDLAAGQQAESNIISSLKALMLDKNRLKEMGRKAHSLHKNNALTDVVDVCQEFLNA